MEQRRPVRPEKMGERSHASGAADRVTWREVRWTGGGSQADFEQSLELSEFDSGGQDL